MRVSGEGCDNQRTKDFRDKRSTEGQCAEWLDRVAWKTIRGQTFQDHRD